MLNDGKHFQQTDLDIGVYGNMKALDEVSWYY